MTAQHFVLVTGDSGLQKRSNKIAEGVGYAPAHGTLN